MSAFYFLWGYICMSNERLTIREACNLFKLSYSQFYTRTLISRFNYPKIQYNKNGIPFLDKKECLSCLKNQTDFFNHHISLIDASRKCFGAPYLLTRYIKNKHYIFNIVMFQNRPYIKLSEFNHFYNDICGKHKLVSLTAFIRHVGIPYSKFYIFAETINLYSKIALSITFNRINKRKLFFKYDDIKKICELYGLKRFVTN